MPQRKPRPSRKRTREIRQRSRATGAKYTAAMRANDNETARGDASWPPAGTPASPHTHGGPFELHGIPVLLTVDVPADVSDAEAAQVVADACDTLVRAGEGWYRAMADVWPVPVRRPSELAGHAHLLMLVSVSGRRPWWTADGGPNQDEVQAFVDDAVTAIRAALHHRYPTTTAMDPELLPVGQDKARDIAEQAGQDVRATTTDPHPSVLGDATAEPAPVPEPERPVYRFVDRHNRGWHIVSTPEGPVRYMVDYGGLRPGRPDTLLTREELEDEHGPLRPVVPGDPGDDWLLRGALADAGVKAAASVLVALFRVAAEYSRGSSPGGYEGGSLCAGREGSWESRAVYDLAWTIGGDLDERPKRFSEECVTCVISVLHSWTQNPKRYVEVAENLAGEFSRVADELGGWHTVADRYLQPGARVGHDRDTVEVVRGYLMSRSSTPWPDDGMA